MFYRITQSKFEANRSRDSLVMTGYTNKLTNRDFFFIYKEIVCIMYVSCILAFFKPYNPFSCIFLKIMFYNFLPSRSFWIPNGWYGGTNMFFNHRVFICLMILTLKETVNVFPRRLLSLGVFYGIFLNWNLFDNFRCKYRLLWSKTLS